MTVDKFKAVLPLVLAHEGGYVNHPKDPGGATNKGVTQRVYDDYRTNRGSEPRSVREITTAEVRDIYRRQYWDRVQGDRLPAGLDYAVFDYAVNSGTNKAVKDLQRVLRLNLIDGQLGEGTLRAAQAAADFDELKLIQDYCGRRMQFLQGLRTWGTFGKGWKRRVVGDFDGTQASDHGVLDYASMMATNDLQFPIPKQELPSAVGSKEGEESGKGLEGEVAMTRTKPGIGAIIGAAGVSGQTVIATAQQVQPHVGESFVGRAALVLFMAMMLVGGLLLAYTFYTTLKEKGAI
jgi:lysozyme family protein